MTQNQFRSHFSPFQINTQFFILFCSQNGRLSAILDDRKSLSIVFLAISDQYTILFYIFAQAFSSYLKKKVFPIFSKIDRVLPL